MDMLRDAYLLFLKCISFRIWPHDRLFFFFPIMHHPGYFLSFGFSERRHWGLNCTSLDEGGLLYRSPTISVPMIECGT